MVVRRSIYVALRWAPIVLPLWYMLVAGLTGWSEVSILTIPLAGIALAVSLAVVLFLTWIRKDVRQGGAVSWADVAVLAPWWVLIIAWPFALDAPIGLFVLIIGLVAFWSAILQWAFETRRRVRSVIEEFSEAATSAREFQARRVTDPGRATPDAPLRGQVIRIEPIDEPPRD